MAKSRLHQEDPPERTTFIHGGPRRVPKSLPPGVEPTTGTSRATLQKASLALTTRQEAAPASKAIVTGAPWRLKFSKDIRTGTCHGPLLFLVQMLWPLQCFIAAIAIQKPSAKIPWYPKGPSMGSLISAAVLAQGPLRHGELFLTRSLCVILTV